MAERASILVVEDDPNGRELLSSLLSEMNYSVTTTASAEEALRFLYSEERCDVVLSDIVLPGMWGNEFKQRSQEARPGLPVVLISGRVEGLESAMASGGVTLVKPVSRSRLNIVLEEALQ